MVFFNGSVYLGLGIIFLLFAFFNKHAISILGVFLIYIGYTNYRLSDIMFWMLMVWIVVSVLYDFRFSLGMGMRTSFLLY
jgi:hypothetical protein